MSSPFRNRIRSPGFRPALSAGLPGMTESIHTGACPLNVKPKLMLPLQTLTVLQLVVELECPAMREVVLRMPRAGRATPSSAWVRGTELARVDTRRRSGWSSLRLRRRWLRLGSLKLRPLIRLIRFWETTSSKRSRCFLGMKIRKCLSLWSLPMALRSFKEELQLS